LVYIAMLSYQVQENSFMTRYRLVSSRLIVAVAAIVCTAANAASVAPVSAEHGMVVTAHRLATKVGVDVLKRGGNAVDSAVAVGYAMAVVYHPISRRAQDISRFSRKGAARSHAKHVPR
jgi:hypothetical protein